MQTNCQPAMRDKPKAPPDEVDKEQLVQDYLPLIHQVARRYSKASSACFEDLVQLGSLGLLKAIKGYDPARCRNASFRSYALLFIKGEMRHYLRDQAPLIKQPRRIIENAQLLSRCEEILRTELQRSPTLAELSLRSGIALEQVLEAARAREICAYYESLDGSDDCWAGDARSDLSESLPDRQQMEAQESEELREGILQSLRKLGDKTRQIIDFVYFQDLSQKETAQRLGWTEMKVSRAIRKGLVKLKDILLTEIF